jgi:hypothetical protein
MIENIDSLMNDLIRNWQYWFLDELHNEALDQYWLSRCAWLCWKSMQRGQLTRVSVCLLIQWIWRINLKNLLICHGLMAKCWLTDDRHNVICRVFSPAATLLLSERCVRIQSSSTFGRIAAVPVSWSQESAVMVITNDGVRLFLCLGHRKAPSW